MPDHSALLGNGSSAPVYRWCRSFSRKFSARGAALAALFRGEAVLGHVFEVH